MNTKSEEQVQTALRLSKSLLARVDKVAARMSQPGMRVTRAEALRLAVFRGIDGLEEEAKKR